MPSPPMIRDSDDEDSLSPEKLPIIELAPNESFFNGIEGSADVDEERNMSTATSDALTGMQNRIHTT